MFCIKCGKEIANGASFCPICGASQNTTAPSSIANNNNYSAPTNNVPVKKARYNTMCILGLVISCISLVLNFWGLVGIAGTVLSTIGLTTYKDRNENGKAQAIIGLCIGIFSIFYGFYSVLQCASAFSAL